MLLCTAEVIGPVIGSVLIALSWSRREIFCVSGLLCFCGLVPPLAAHGVKVRAGTRCSCLR